MAITVNLRYTGKNDAAQAFAREMILRSIFYQKFSGLFAL